MQGCNKFICCLLIALVQNIFCQDSIYKKNGEIIASKILEINDHQVKFKEFNSLNGSTYSELKSELLWIKFENGTVDTINSVVVEEEVQGSIADYVPKQSIKYKMVDDEETLRIIELLPASDSKTKMKSEYALMKKYQKKQYFAGTLGFVIGFAVPIAVSSVVLLGNDYYEEWLPIVVTGAITGAVIRTAGQVIQKMNRNKRMNARKNIVRIYDEM